MVTVEVNAVAIVSFTVEIDEEDLIDQSIREYIEENLHQYESEASIESLDDINDLEVE